MCFNQIGDIFTQGGCSLKLVDKFTYLGSSVSSIEADIDSRLTKAWTAIDKLSVIWKSDLTDKMKRRFLPSSGRVDTTIWMHYTDANWTDGEKARRQPTQECCEQFWTSPGGNTPQSPNCTATYLPLKKLSKTNQTCRTLLEKQGRAHKWCTPMDPVIWPNKSRTTSSNLHTAALWGYGM